MRRCVWHKSAYLYVLGAVPSEPIKYTRAPVLKYTARIIEKSSGCIQLIDSVDCMSSHFLVTIWMHFAGFSSLQIHHEASVAFFPSV